MTTKVLIVDDSVLIRQWLTEVLTSDPDITVVGSAADPIIARDKIKQLNPDVITLDVEMPRMDGITFLKNLMRLRPMPVVMISTLTQVGALVTLDALEIGAVDFIAKSDLNAENIESVGRDICAKVKSAATAKVHPFDPQRYHQKSTIQPLHKDVMHTDCILAIGASTGGTEAIKDVLMNLPGQMCPVVITQHIPAAFSQSYAQRLDRHCQMNVVQATDGMKVNAGYAYLAPGDWHLRFQNSAKGLICRLDDGPVVNRHRPSVEVMFDSLREQYSGRIISIMLTGMGSDGAEAMGRLHETRHSCIVQDEESSVVWGMPGAAYRLGVVDTVTPLAKIPKQIMSMLSKKP